MANKSPVFPIPQHPQHFSDYGFDPQIDYLQVLEEAKKHKKDFSRSIDNLHFKLQKPISKEESKKNKNRKKKWWKNALLFWKKKVNHNNCCDEEADDYIKRSKEYRGLSGPVYITESRSGSSTPCRVSSRPTSGPLAGTLTPMRKGDFDVPYVSLRELNMEQYAEEQNYRFSTSAMPIYLVT
ncbi:hypothetical protein FRX31_003325 [Thalictrum thalictroides]|uniref:Uncharacterized protein n=1 Tax=Thalictrum thalictroides TaxID=46969 RepID=A0A7J6XFE0_THATH|nr:hypothetical protein FRX31_003325 [Thalictrum thalictroides]